MILRCSRCLLPSNYPEVTFNDQGICNFCLEYKEVDLLGETQFLQKIRSLRGAQYDCLVGISGGKDSCYVAYLARKKFGLRVLAVSYDFPFMVDLARKNTRSVCDQLGIELLIVKSRNNLEYGLLRNHLISLSGATTTWGQCMFCHYGIEAILYKTATDKGIPFILSGVTRNEVWWDPGNRLQILTRRLKDLSLNEKILFAYYQSKAYVALVDQRKQFPIAKNSCFSVYSRANPPDVGPQTIRVFDYLKWDQDLIEKTLQEETGWEKPERSLTWRYDCILEPLLDYTFKKDLGISSTGLYLCGLVRSGDLRREEALQILEENEDQSRLNTSLKNVLNYLDIPAKVQVKFFGGNGSQEK